MKVQQLVLLESVHKKPRSLRSSYYYIGIRLLIFQHASSLPNARSLFLYLRVVPYGQGMSTLLKI